MYANRQNLIESLEPRRLLTTFFIAGTSGPDDIAVWVPGDGQIHLRVGAATAAFPDATYNAIQIDTFGGDDTISIGGIGTNATNVNAGAGDDQISVTGQLAGDLFGIDATLLIDGGADRDSMSIDDHLETSGIAYQIDVANFHATGITDVSHFNIERFDLYGGPGVSYFSVNSTGPNTAWFIHGNDGDDNLILNDRVTSLDPIQGEIRFFGEGGTSDQVYVSDTSPATGRHYIVGGHELFESTGTFGGLFFDTTEFAQIVGSYRSDSFDIQSSVASTQWDIYGNAGSDQFLLNSFHNLDLLQGHINLYGGSLVGDFDQLVIRDDDVAAADPYTITPTTVSRPFFAGVTYAEMDSLSLSAQEGANVITVNGTSCPVVIDGRGGDDKIHVLESALGAPVYVLSSPGLDSVAVNEDATGFAQVLFKETVHLNDLFVNQGGEARMEMSGSRLLCAKTLTINGVVDLTDNDLIVTDTPRATIESYIRSAYNFGDWLGAGGLFSTTARGNPAGNTTLGLLSGREFNDNNGGLFDGQVVNNSDVVVKYTYYGDVDFNGRVDVSDYNLIDNGFANHLNGWANGDADWSGGATDVSDYNLIDFAFATQTGVL